MSAYIFQSERLKFRNWKASDLDLLHAINSDDEVMEYFPFKPSREDTAAFIERMQKQYEEKGFCYFAVELIENNAFIGFIGLSVQNFEADFTPCVDIGWRLSKDFWFKGYATEGAKACLEFGFNQIQLDHIVSMAPVVNEKSIAVMEKIGMQQVQYFEHPKLNDYKWLQKCVLFNLNKHN